MVRAVDQIHVEPALSPVFQFHLEHADIGISGQHLQMLLREPLFSNAGHLETIKRVFGHRIRKSCHAQPEPLRELPAHIDRLPVPRLPGQSTQASRYFGQNIGSRSDPLLHLRVDLVEPRRLLEDTIINRVVAFLIGRRADHAVLKAVPVLAVESQIDCQMTVRPLDLSEPGQDLVALLLGDHEKRVALHMLLELILFVVQFLPEIIVIEERP